jgi:hypothetical protein
MSSIRIGISCLALLAMTAESYAVDLCDQGAASALKTAAVQQQLMVAGLTCNASRQYNRFVVSHRAELQTSDAALMVYFKSRDGGSEAGYDAYKTKLANLSASRSAADSARYCRAMARDFIVANHSSLQDFVAGERLVIATAEPCATKYDEPDVAVAGPSYALPASPYGSEDAVASANYENTPPVQKTSQPAPAWKGGPVYGAPASSWPPPRPRRTLRWDPWYGRYIYYYY